MSELRLDTAPKTVRRGAKRVGRGDASGKGTYSGRGLKGQRSRSGGRRRPGFEGGRMPLIQQIPKVRGFTSGRPKHATVNVSDLEQHFDAKATVTIKGLISKGLLPSNARTVKILGSGELKKSLTVQAHDFSASAKKKIKDAGGTIQGVS